MIIESDLYDIVVRLKEIDDGYFVQYRRGRFEVHNRFQRGDTLALILPFDRLDERAVRLVRKTRRERRDAFVKEMEIENAKLQKEQEERERRRALKNIEEGLRI